MIKNTKSSYGLITKLLHWVIGIGIIGMLVVGFIMTDMPPADEKWQLYFVHKSIGVTILGLVALRILWRFVNVQLDLPSDLPGWQKSASKITHFLLYVFMFLMPVSGVLMSRFGGHEINVFNLFTISALEKDPALSSLFSNMHGFSAIIFSLLIALHVCGGLYHHFVRRDNILIRMIK